MTPRTTLLSILINKINTMTKLLIQPMARWLTRSLMLVLLLPAGGNFFAMAQERPRPAPQRPAPQRPAPQRPTPPPPAPHPPGTRPPGHVRPPGNTRPPDNTRPPGNGRPPGNTRPPVTRPPGNNRPPVHRPPINHRPPGWRPSRPAYTRRPHVWGGRRYY